MTQQGFTNKEAIERLKCMRLFMQINDRDSTNKFLDEDYVANEMAVKAIERMIPKKPTSKTHCKDGNSPLSQIIGRCPSCDCIVAEDMIWCDDCGQKLDWSES